MLHAPIIKQKVALCPHFWHGECLIESAANNCSCLCKPPSLGCKLESYSIPVSIENQFPLVCFDTLEVEELAHILHESGREAVLLNKVHKKDGAPLGQIVFKEWDEISEDAREGRRIQARFLIKHLFMIKKGD